MLQVSLSQLQSAMLDEFKFSEFESYDSDLDVQMELEVLGSLLEDLF
nr:MAG TPA: hypothetical protein [Caudoviricetes sp.]